MTEDRHLLVYVKTKGVHYSNCPPSIPKLTPFT